MTYSQATNRHSSRVGTSDPLSPNDGWKEHRGVAGATKHWRRCRFPMAILGRPITTTVAHSIISILSSGLRHQTFLRTSWPADLLSESNTDPVLPIAVFGEFTA